MWKIVEADPKHPSAKQHWVIIGNPEEDPMGLWEALEWLHKHNDMSYYGMWTGNGKARPIAMHVIIGDLTKESVKMPLGCAPTCTDLKPWLSYT